MWSRLLLRLQLRLATPTSLSRPRTDSVNVKHGSSLLDTCMKLRTDSKVLPAAPTFVYSPPSILVLPTPQSSPPRTVNNPFLVDVPTMVDHVNCGQ